MAKKKIVEKEVVKPTESVDLSSYEKKIDQADSLITKLWGFLKKHWGKLIILLLIYGGYKFCVLVGEEMDKPKQEQEQVTPIEVVNTEPFVVREFEEEQVDGSFIIIQKWSDSLETVKK
jgi:hypothetical protein